MLKIVCLTIFAAAALYAQSMGTASLVSTITDGSGALIPNAKVTARNQESSFLYETTSNDTGSYYIPNMRLGSYTLSVESGGFKTSVQRDIVLRINETPRIDMRLEVGNVSETVSVSSTAPLLARVHQESCRDTRGSCATVQTEHAYGPTHPSRKRAYAYLTGQRGLPHANWPKGHAIAA